MNNKKAFTIITTLNLIVGNAVMFPEGRDYESIIHAIKLQTTTSAVAILSLFLLFKVLQRSQNKFTTAISAIAFTALVAPVSAYISFATEGLLEGDFSFLWKAVFLTLPAMMVSATYWLPMAAMNSILCLLLYKAQNNRQSLNIHNQTTAPTIKNKESTMELEVTWKRATRVWWSYLWRNLIVLIVAIIAGAIAGGILGFILGLIGTPREVVQVLVMPVGFIIGLGASIIPLKLILGKNFGEFRLVLVGNPNNENM